MSTLQEDSAELSLPPFNAEARGDLSEPDVASEIAALTAAWTNGDATDTRLRRRCAEWLSQLRGSYREAPQLFDGAAIAQLKAIAEALRAPLPAREKKEGQSARDVLRETFGYDAFRAGQEEIIEAILAGRDCVGVMPTGAGKSITYQIPARLLGGLTLVISPLIALMKDQVDAMQEVGLRATFLNSSLDAEERSRRVAGLREGAYELLYAAPEGLEASVGGLLRDLDLALIAVDEAHCISQWGHDFRPAYRNLAGLKGRFGGIPMLALTATATHAVTDDIIHQLGMQTPALLRGSFFRPNLKLHAYKKGGADDGTAVQVRESILRLVLAREGQSGIVYCLSRKSVESVAEFLRDHGVSALPYHAGLDPELRAQTQDKFRRDEVDVVVATVAFGMGIDKPDIRFVIHRDMPRSIEGYYQEIGRAGRDGLPSDCVLFYSWADVLAYERFQTEGSPAVAERQKQQGREMINLAERAGCRHQGLVRHLGETVVACGRSCDRCLSSDILSEAPKVVARRKARTESFGDRPKVGPAQAPLTAQAGELFLELKTLRRKLADAKSLPAYIVFSDATLMLMAAKRPKNPEEMLSISGIGQKKLDQYGAEFLACIAEHRS